MAYQAVVKDGGIFIPNVNKNLFKKNRARIDIVIVNNEKQTENAILKTSGILKGRIGDGVEYESKIRSEWSE